MTDNHPILKDFPMYGWTPDTSLSDDDNCMDMVLVVTRNSKCNQGHMGCAIVRPMNEEEQPLLDRIVAVTNNSSVYKERDSDNHAEINAIAQAAKFGRSTDGCTAIITIPPCKRCFGALMAAGITKIVSSRTLLDPMNSVAKKNGIEVVAIDTRDNDRIEKLLPKPTREEVEAARELRKRDQQAKKSRRKDRLAEQETQERKRKAAQQAV